MKILFHIDSLGSGGAQRQIVTLAAGLAGRGHRVEFNTYVDFNYFKPVLDQAGVPVHTKIKTGRLSPGPVLSLRRHVRTLRPDVVIAFLRVPVIHAELLKIIGPRVPVLVSERFAYPAGKLPWRLYLGQLMHRLADRVTINSTHQAHRMFQDFPWLEGKSSVVLNGYDLTDPPAPVPPTTDDIRLLALGTIQPRKNPLTLAKAMVICRRDHGVPVSIHWGGEMRSRYSATKPEVDNFLAAEGMADHWHWLGLRSDVPDLLASMHGLIHASHAEGFSNAVAEALIAGRPVLLGRIGDQPDLIARSQAGLLFDQTDPASIAEAISSYHAKSDTERTEMGANGRIFAEENLSVDAMVSRYEDLCAELANR